ncbi:MAG: hypothetical protein KAR79_04545 [Simkaniaceae bacterium]|nr:hypothetical protein [Simkaniaceae bacterium]
MTIRFGTFEAEAFRSKYGRNPHSLFDTPTKKKVDYVVKDAIKPFFSGKSAPLFLGVSGGIVNLPNKLHGFVSAIRNAPTPPHFQVMSGATSSVAMITGLFGSGNGHLAEIEAKSIGDESGELIGRVSVINGGLKSLTGALLIPYKVISYAFAGASILSSLGITLTTIASVVYTLALVSPMIALNEHREFQEKYQHVLGKSYPSEEKKLSAVFQFFREELKISAADKEQILERSLKNANRDPLNEEERAKWLQPSHYLWIHQIRNAKPEYKDRFFQLEKEVARALKKKEALMKRSLGKTAFDLIKQEGSQPTKELHTKIDEAMTKKWRGLALKVGGVALSIISIIAGIILTKGIILFTISALTLGISLYMLGIDLYELLESFETAKKPSTTEKVMMVFGAVILGAALSAGFIFSGGLPLLIMYSIATLLLVLLSGYAYQAWYQKKPLPDNLEGCKTA